MIPEAPLGEICQVEIPGGRAGLSAAASLFSPSGRWACLPQIQGPVLLSTQGQGLGGSESPHLSDSVQPLRLPVTRAVGAEPQGELWPNGWAWAPPRLLPREGPSPRGQQGGTSEELTKMIAGEITRPADLEEEGRWGTPASSGRPGSSSGALREGGQQSTGQRSRQGAGTRRPWEPGRYRKCT